MEISCSSLLASIDNLWFYQIVLLPEPISATYSKPALPSSNLAQVSDHSEKESVSIDSFTGSVTSQDDPRTELEEEKAVGNAEREIPTRLSLKSNNGQSKSPFPPKHTLRKSLNYSIDNGQRLQSFLNCKILRDLEQLELKGFMDLGFEFKSDGLSPRTMNMIPGLKRLGIGKQTNCNVNENQETSTVLDDEENEVEKEKRRVVKVKPYLSDAWLVKQPNSPLLRLKMARVSTAQDMKECLKLWARTVVSSVISVQ
ncbi:hypothetical protein KSS87_011158 [Heliosperma pusillum]|nr:hypothetical protein KSS87_011158 [Heliosperma pusillum]